MALSYFSASEAPRDFRVSSTESDGHYTKCLLCYTVKRNFYCQDCIKTGSFMHSSMPYSDRYSEKQAKLLRLKANRKHVLDRCEKLLSHKIKKDNLLTETKQSRDRLDLIRLAIEQRRSNIDDKRKVLMELKQQNHDLSMKLPRYQKRVSLLGKHAQDQRLELQNKMSAYSEQADALAALRRSRIRQLTKYIFPVYISYDTSDSIEDMEFVGEDEEEEPPRRCQLHILSPWINTDGDFSQVQAWLAQSKEGMSGSACAAPGGWPRAHAALALAAQLAALLAWTLDMRLPHAIALSEYCTWRAHGASPARLARRLRGACAALGARCGLPPPAPPHSLHSLHSLARAADTDDPSLGRVEPWACESAEGESKWADWEWGEDDLDDNEPPEHLNWPETMDEIEELSCTPPAPAASLVTSAASSIASFWRGWTK